MAHSVTLKADEVRSLSSGSHGDPFSVLGLHQMEVDGKMKWILRTFQPHAESVTVLPSSGNASEMIRVTDEGLFEVLFPRRKKRFQYRLEIDPYEGEKYEIEDPYQFGTLLSDFDLQLWGEGTHRHVFRWMGAHVRKVDGVSGTQFVVVAPNAWRVSVIGSFNNWDGRVHGMRKHPAQGIWEIFIPGVEAGDSYKFEIQSDLAEAPLKKADPYAFYAEQRPGTASVVWKSGYEWSDRGQREHLPDRLPCVF